MANNIYPIWKASIMALTTNNALTGIAVPGPYCVLLTTGYTYSGAHQFYTSITAGNVGTDQPLTTSTPCTVTNGLFAPPTANPSLTYTAVAAGSTISELVVYVHNSTTGGATWPLVVYFDTFTALATNGGNITVTWNASGIFQL
jgi:hypothetical protein